MNQRRSERCQLDSMNQVRIFPFNSDYCNGVGVRRQLNFPSLGKFLSRPLGVRFAIGRHFYKKPLDWFSLGELMSP